MEPLRSIVLECKSVEDVPMCPSGSAEICAFMEHFEVSRDPSVVCDEASECHRAIANARRRFSCRT